MSPSLNQPGPRVPVSPALGISLAPSASRPQARARRPGKPLMSGMPPIPDTQAVLSVEPLQCVEEKHAQDVLFFHALRIFHAVGSAGRTSQPLVDCPPRKALRGQAFPRRIFRPTGDMRPERHHADHGSVSLWLVIFAFTTIALLVLVVDGGQTMNAKSRAADIAEQAARAAADDVNVGQLRGGTIGLGGNACDLKQGPAAQLVASYAAGVPGATATLTNCTSSVTDVGGNPSLTVTATVQLSVRPALPVPPFTTISATAQETAYLACGSADALEAC